MIMLLLIFYIEKQIKFTVVQRNCITYTYMLHSRNRLKINFSICINRILCTMLGPIIRRTACMYVTK